MKTAIVPGLSAADSQKYVDTLMGTCDIRVVVEQLTLSHELMATLEPVQLDGQLNITGGETDTIVRTMQMGFLDPDHALQLDSDVASAGVGGIDRLLRVSTYARSGTSDWIGAAAATMRPSVISRNGDVVTLEAQSKEALHLRGVSPFTIPKGTPKIEAIRRILELGGETRFRFPGSTSARLSANTVVGGKDELLQPWKVAWRIARSLDMQLYFDTTGYACLRHYPDVPVWKLIEQGPGANMLTRPKLTTDLSNIRNRVVVTGHTKATKKTKSKVLTADVRLEPEHPLSAQSLRQNGKDWWATEFYDEPTLHTQAAVNAFARARLTEWSTEKTDIETSTFPFWHAVSMDLLESQTAAGGHVRHRLDSASIPLGPSESGMTIGYQQRVRSASAGRLRRRKAA